jgi:hypothetical protein
MPNAASSNVLDEAQDTPSQAVLLEYYRFLWLEMKRLSIELGVPMMHTETLMECEGEPPKEWRLSPPSSRAEAVLAAVTKPKTPVPSAGICRLSFASLEGTALQSVLG